MNSKLPIRPHSIHIQGIPAFRDFTIRDPQYFVIWFQAIFREIPRHFVIFEAKKKKEN